MSPHIRRQNKRDDARVSSSDPEIVGVGVDADHHQVLPISGSSETAAEGTALVDPEMLAGEPTPAKRPRKLSVDKVQPALLVRGTYDSTEEIEFRVNELALSLGCHKKDLTRCLLVRAIEGFKVDERAKRAFQVLRRGDAEVA